MVIYRLDRMVFPRSTHFNVFATSLHGEKGKTFPNIYTNCIGCGRDFPSVYSSRVIYQALFYINLSKKRIYSYLKLTHQID